MNTNWKQDPRLKGMDPQNSNCWTTFAKEVESAPKDQLMSTILTLNLKANEKGIHFFRSGDGTARLDPERGMSRRAETHGYLTYDF